MGFTEWAVSKLIVAKIKESVMWKFLEGKKTIIICVLTMIFGAIDAYNQHCGTAGCKIIEIPAIVFTILGALGIWTRSVAKPK